MAGEITHLWIDEAQNMLTPQTPHDIWDVPKGLNVIHWVVMRLVRTGELGAALNGNA